MGDQQISPLTSRAKVKFLRNLLDDIAALEQMIEEGMIESGKTRLGAEQEYCLVGPNLRPSMAGPDVLAATTDPHFTAELAQWNLEINLDPLDVGPGCLTSLEDQLVQLLREGSDRAAEHNARIALTGILPTIRRSDLDFENMTPNPRYRVLDSILKQLRGEAFSLSIEGVDEINLKTESILFEACNTSFQIHLQIEPDEFVDRYNWAQVVAGPVLSACVNSPLLLGRELWQETRIALFRQSLDVRHAGTYARDKQPRVAFGEGWLRESVLEIFKNDVAIYRLLISAEVEQNSLEMLREGKIPQLRAMNLHNGTLYKWNRACYGVGHGVPHLRIENRYIPAGPTVMDEVANAAFWCGLMLAMPDAYRGAWDSHFDFREVRHNFLKAAQHGLANEFYWAGRSRTASALLLDDLLPLAAEGLASKGIPAEESDRWLQIIADRVVARQTGAAWIIQSMRKLRDRHSLDESLLILTEHLVRNQESGEPVHTWEPPDDKVLSSIPDRYARVDSIMNGNVITVRIDDPLDYAATLMDWYGYHHLPVENNRGQIRGVVTAVDLAQFAPANDELPRVRDCMTRKVLTVGPDASVDEVEQLMLDRKIGSLPVVSDDRVIGIITANDIRAVRRKQQGG